MKSKDLAIIGGAVIISIIVSIFVSKAVFVNPSRSQSVDIIPPLPSTFSSPSKRYFNKYSIDPTKFISIKNSSNQNPFSSGSSQN